MDINKLIAQIVSLINSLIGTPKFSKFATKPGEILGYGVDQSWMYLDADKLGNALVKAGVNTTSIGLFSCNETSNPIQPPQGPWGYWMDHFNELKPTLTKFLDAMKKRKITVYVTLTGWNQLNGNFDPQTGKGATICCNRYNVTWFTDIVDYFVKRGTDGIIICTAGEPVPNYGPGGPCIDKFSIFTNVLNSKWSGLKGWNYGVRPNTAPVGYYIETHPQKSSEKSPAGCIVLTDGPAASEFGNHDLNCFIDNGPALQAYIKRIHSEGSGFIWWGMSFNGKNVDYNGIKIVGNALK